MKIVCTSEDVRYQDQAEMIVALAKEGSQMSFELHALDLYPNSKPRIDYEIEQQLVGVEFLDDCCKPCRSNKENTCNRNNSML